MGAARRYKFHMLLHRVESVSYTHLDVYKRQVFITWLQKTQRRVLSPGELLVGSFSITHLPGV